MPSFPAHLIAVLLSLSSIGLASENWDAHYERPLCNSDDDPSGDVVLKCGESPTVKRLEVDLKTSELANRFLSASIYVTNANDYPVFVRTLFVDAKNRDGEVISFCSIGVEEAIYPGEGFAKEFSCMFPETGVDIDQEIDSAVIRATPWQ